MFQYFLRCCTHKKKILIKNIILNHTLFDTNYCNFLKIILKYYFVIFHKRNVNKFKMDVICNFINMYLEIANNNEFFKILKCFKIILMNIFDYLHCYFFMDDLYVINKIIENTNFSRDDVEYNYLFHNYFDYFYDHLCIFFDKFKIIYYNQKLINVKKNQFDVYGDIYLNILTYNIPMNYKNKKANYNKIIRIIYSSYEDELEIIEEYIDLSAISIFDFNENNLKLI